MKIDNKQIQNHDHAIDDDQRAWRKLTLRLAKYRDQRYAARIAAVGFSLLSVMLGFTYDQTDNVAPIVYFVLYGLILLAITSEIFIYWLKVKPAEMLMDEMDTRLTEYIRYHGFRT